jgi:hypothetical protein
MAQNNAFDKIQNFVKEQIDSAHKVVITATATGYRVNNLTILQKDGWWTIFDSNKTEICHLKSQRLAILYASSIIKKRYSTTNHIKNIDATLDILKHDKSLFEHKINKNFKRELFEDRYSRTMFELNQVYGLISKLEKSVGLQ